MTINTERVFIKPLSAKDNRFILALLNTDGWLKYIGNRNVNSEADAMAYIQKINENPNISYWVVTLKETDIAIGLITLIQRDYLPFKDIGFAFLPAFSGKGYAYEAAKGILSKMEEKNILAITLPENKPSIKLIEKLGLKFEKIIEQDKEQLHLYSALKMED
jgi:RimJ/RimL family protein N-acetyltransferase